MTDSSPPSTASSTAAASQTDASSRPPVSTSSMLWPVLLGLAVLGTIGYFTYEPGVFREMWRTLNLWLLLGAVVMTAMQVFFGGWRFSFVSGERFGLVAGMRVQAAWQFFANVTPSAVGGGPPAALYMARDQNITVGDATALMLFTILLDQLWFAITIPLLLVASFYLELAPPALGNVGPWSIFIAFVGLLCWSGTFAYLTLFRPDRLRALADWLFKLKFLRRFRERVGREMHQMARRSKTLRLQPPSFFLKGVLLTGGLWMARYLLVVFIIWSVYPDLDQLLALIRTAAMLLFALILPTPGGAGGLEGLYALFLGPLMPAALMAPTLLTWRILGYYIFIALGIYLSAHHAQKAIRRRQLEERNQRIVEPTSQASA